MSVFRCIILMFQILATHEQACWNSGEDADIWHGTGKKTQE